MLRFLFKLLGISRQSRRDWSAMPMDILGLISDRLSPVDYLRFRGVCTHWRSSPSDRSELVNFSKDQQWLMIHALEKNTHKCYIYSQSHPRCCIIELHDLMGSNIVESKLGWLLGHHGQFFFLYNPLTFSRINLPRLCTSGLGVCATFTYLPTNRECKIIVLSRKSKSKVVVNTCNVGDKKWSTQMMRGSNDIARIIGIVTCNHTDVDVCPSDLNDDLNELHFYDSKDVFDAHVAEQKSKLKMVEHETEVKNGEEYEMAKQVDDMKSMHKEEWDWRFGERGITFTFWSKRPGETLVRCFIAPRVVDERTEFDMVKANFFKPQFL